MRILVTGGAGALGRNIVAHYLSREHELLVLDNYATGARGAFARQARLEEVEGSVADKGLVDAVFASFRPTHVIHAAASYKDPQNWGEDSATNATGTAFVAQAARAGGVSRLVYLQTALAYGAPTTDPIRPDHPLDPFTSYGISKAAGERYVRLAGIPWVSLRTAIVYGPYHMSGPIPTFAQRLSKGQPCFAVRTTRDFLYWSDFRDLLDRTLQDGAPTGAFNAGSGTQVTMAELHEAIADKLGVVRDGPVEMREPGGRRGHEHAPFHRGDHPCLPLASPACRSTRGWTASLPGTTTMVSREASRMSRRIETVPRSARPDRVER